MDETKNPAAPVPEAKLHFLDYWRVIRIRKAIIITVFLITSIIATTVTFLLPESYSSTARIEVQNDGGIIQGMATPAASGFVYDPYFIQNTFEIIQSEVVLSNVIARLDLNNVWGKKFNNGAPFKTTETMTILKGRMALAPVKNTKLIAITVYSDDNKEAAQLANTIADTYRQYRLDQTKDITDAGLTALNESYLEESNRIETMTAHIDDLRKNLGISDDNSPVPTPTLEKEELNKLHDQLIEGKNTYTEQLTQIQSLENIAATNRDELRDVIPTMFPDSALSDLLSQLRDTQQKYNVALQDYNATNIVVTRLKALLDTLEQEVDGRVDGVMVGLESQTKAKRASIDSLQGQLDDARQRDFDNAAKFEPYYDEKMKLAQLLETHRLLYTKIKAEAIDAAIPKTTMVQITDSAEPGKSPVRPNKPVNIALGVIFGLLMGVGLAFFIEYLDTSVKTIDDVERTFQAPVLGVIPQNIGYLLEEGSESKHAEAYRVLRTNLLFSRTDEKLNTIVVVSAGAGEGKSTTTINLATVFAQAGNRVLIVDSDLRRPTLHKLFKVANNLGLTNYLLKQNTLSEVVQTTPVPNMDFMASGRLPNSSMGILGSSQMKEMIAELKQRYDFIFFDSPPILGVSDASILASEVDLVMQVIQYRRYPQPMTIRAKQMIEKVGGNFVGLVLNNINMSQDEGYYYYSGYYQDYYYSREAGEKEAQVKGDKPDQDGDDDTNINVKQKY